MTTDLKKQNAWLDDMVNNYNTVIESIKEQLAGIDEYYRKQCEDAKKNLNTCLVEAESQKAFWEGALKNGLEISAPAKRTRKKKVSSDEQKEEVEQAESTEPEVEQVEPDKVVDEIYPENNEPEEEAEAEAPAEKPEEQKTDDEWPFDEEQDAEPKENADESENVESKDINTDEGWPDFPEDWK